MSCLIFPSLYPWFSMLSYFSPSVAFESRTTPIRCAGWFIKMAYIFIIILTRDFGKLCPRMTQFHTKNCKVFIQLFESGPFHFRKMSLIFVVSLWFMEKWSRQNLLHGNMRAVKLSCSLLLFAFEVINNLRTTSNSFGCWNFQPS